MTLKNGDREVLERLVRSGKGTERQRKRARIVLLAAEGQSNRAIAEAVSLHHSQVGVWRKRYEAMGLDGLAGNNGAPSRRSAR